MYLDPTAPNYARQQMEGATWFSARLHSSKTGLMAYQRMLRWDKWHRRRMEWKKETQVIIAWSKLCGRVRVSSVSCWNYNIHKPGTIKHSEIYKYHQGRWRAHIVHIINGCERASAAPRSPVYAKRSTCWELWKQPDLVSEEALGTHINARFYFHSEIVW